MESPESERSTSKKPRALEKFLMEIQIELEIKFTNFFPKRHLLSFKKPLNYTCRIKVIHQRNNSLGCEKIFLVGINCIFVIIGIITKQEIAYTQRIEINKDKILDSAHSCLNCFYSVN